MIKMNTAISQTIDIQGHRGSRGLMPENTIPAFLHALSFDYITTLELDVVISKDKKVVISHEPYMNSLFTSWPNGTAVKPIEEKSINLYEMDYSQIIQFDVGQRGNARFQEQQKMAAVKPLLNELFVAVNHYKKQNPHRNINFNIEIKSEATEYGFSQPNVEEFSDLVYKEIAHFGHFEAITLQSFDFEVLKHWHKKMEMGTFKKVKLAALVERKGPKRTFRELDFVPDIFSPNYKILRKSQIDFCHLKNCQVIPWTVNDPKIMQNLVEMKVDGLITDYPDRAKIVVK